MRPVTVMLAAAAALGLPAVPAMAATVKGTCLLAVGGTAYLDGPCDIALEPDGSFQITGDGTGGRSYFAYVFLDGKDRATGHWNGPEAGGHAHTPLGPLTRDGACWQNRDARVCAWR